MLKTRSDDEDTELKDILDHDSALVEEFTLSFIGTRSRVESPQRKETELSHSTEASEVREASSWVSGDDKSIVCVQKIGHGDVTQVYKVKGIVDKVSLTPIDGKYQRQDGISSTAASLTHLISTCSFLLGK